MPRTPTQLHSSQYSGTGLATPKSPALVGGQHFVTMYQESGPNGGLYSPTITSDTQIPVAYATIENTSTSSAQTDVNNNVVNTPPSDLGHRLVTTVANIGMTSIAIQGDPQQHGSDHHPPGHGVAMTTVANSSNGYHGGIPLAALGVPPSPGFFNGTCKSFFVHTSIICLKNFAQF